MTRIVIILIMFVFITSCTSIDKSVTIKDKEALRSKIKIAVIPFKDAPGFPGSGLAVSDALTNELIKIKNFEVVERTQLSNIIKEQSLDATGLTKNDFNSIGRLAKTDFIIVGSVVDYSYERKFYIVPKTKLAFNARLINTTKGTLAGTVRLNLETGKRAWLGCCLLSVYYIPIAMLTDENINADVTESAEQIVEAIKDELKK